MAENEVRQGFELRAYEDEGGPVIEGTAIVFGEKSADIGFREIMDPGSVSFDDDVVLDFDHKTQYILGRQSNGTLDITTDDRGVHFRARPPKTTWVSDLLVSMREGFINQCSFMFRPIDDEWEVNEGEVIRHVKEALVSALSIVSMPAYPQTSAEARDKAAELVGDAEATIAEDTGLDADRVGEPVAEGGSPKPGRTHLIAGRLVTLPDPKEG